MPGDASRFVSSDDDATQDLPSREKGGETERQTDGAIAPTMPFSADLAADQSPAPLPTMIGRHRVRELLGEGTFGAVYRCYDEQLRRDVAIKLPHGAGAPSAERLQAFLHEAQSAARLRHPAIVAVLDIGQTDDGRGFIVYEYIAGDTLRARIERRDYTLDQAVEWTIELADALNYAHRQGLVHRDIKPANVLIDPAGLAHLTDFGLAKLDDHYFTDDAGRVLGTVAYMSPEQARGHSHWASPQADLYSLGVMLYQLLTGRLPFRAGSTLDLLEQVQRRDPPPLRTLDDSIPKELEAICLRALAKSASDRYTTAADMAADLRRIRQPPAAERRNSRLLLAGLLVLAGGAGAWQLWSRGGAQQPSNGAIPLVAPPAISVPTLTIGLQRSWEHKGEHKQLELADLPLRDGDRLQFHALLPRPAYAYIYWYDPSGVGQRVWPEAGAAAGPVSEIWSPVEAQQSDLATWWPVEGALGTEVVLMVTTDHALSPDELAEFEATHLALSGQLSRTGSLVEIASQPGNAATRKLGAKVVSAKTALASDFQRELTARFKSYHGWALAHE